MSSRDIPQDSRLESAVFIGLLLLLVWTPLPLGSHVDWALRFWNGAVFVLASLWILGWALGHCSLPAWMAGRRLGLALTGGLFAITVAWLYRQAGLPGLEAISLDAYRTRLEADQSLALMLWFWLCLLTLNTQQRLRWLAYVLIASGAFQAFYGSFMSLSGLEYGFFRHKTHGVGVATGTFVNRNHLAGYLEMTLAVGIGFLIGGKFTRPGRTWRDLMHQAAGLLLSKMAPLRILTVIMAIGLVLTRSRMGNVGFGAALSIAATLYLLLATSKASRYVAGILWVSILLVDMFFVGSYFGLEQLAERMESTTQQEFDDRLDLKDHGYPYVQHYLWQGSGAGTFVTAFPQFSGEDVRPGELWDHLHNDYLEFAGEFGLIGALPLAGVMLLCFWQALRALRRQQDPMQRGLAFAAVMGLMSMAIHSWVDFNLQMPANAVLYVTLLALAWVSAHLGSRPRRRRRSAATDTEDD
ncbi:MAG: hypothetical protein RIQ52_1285 [Pseudomonadota bacterium]